MAMPLMRGGRPLKEWTYVGAFGPELMLCAATARIGIVRVSWWAIWDREAGRLVQRTARGRGGVDVSPRHVAVRGRAASLGLTVDDGTPIEVTSRHGTQDIWTRKRAGVRAHGWVETGGARREVDLRAVVDESAGYHARRTAWCWSAGVGTLETGEPVAWNLVDGIHDGSPSERAVWVAGEPHEVAPVRFAGDLSAVGALRFTAEATRERHENLLVLRSDYVQPFGRFAGEVPGAGTLREGWGVMERHDVAW